MKKILAPVAFALVVATATCTAFVGAFHAGIASAQPAVADAGSESSAGSAEQPKPSDAIHDPVSNPAEAYSDLKAAKKTGWAIFVLTIMIVACRLLSRLGGIFKRLGEGKFSLGVAAATALALTAYNSIALGGSPFAGLMVGIVAAFAAWDAKAKPPEPAQPPGG